MSFRRKLVRNGRIGLVLDLLDQNILFSLIILNDLSALKVLA